MADQDDLMADDSNGDAAASDDKHVIAPSENRYYEIDDNRIRILPGASDTAASFEFLNEDHTLGNALRYMIMKNPEVELCGYSIPHPSEAKMNIRIQTYDATTVYDALEKGFDDLMALCDVVTDKFTIARDAFDAEQEA
ncbi:MAG: hypothetical protein Q9164_000447 [Protoblastenia rupestris]